MPLKNKITKIVHDNHSILPYSFLYLEVGKLDKSSRPSKVINSRFHQTKSYRLDPFDKIISNIPYNE